MEALAEETRKILEDDKRVVNNYHIYEHILLDHSVSIEEISLGF